MSKITHIIKRDGSQVAFTPNRIANAIYRLPLWKNNFFLARYPTLKRCKSWLNKNLLKTISPQLPRLTSFTAMSAPANVPNAVTATACPQAISPGTSSGNRLIGQFRMKCTPPSTSTKRFVPTNSMKSSPQQKRNTLKMTKPQQNSF